MIVLVFWLAALYTWAEKGSSASPQNHTQFIQVMTDAIKKLKDYKEDKARAPTMATAAEGSKILVGDVSRSAVASRLQLSKRAGAGSDE
ncbi:unnamed protein product [Phytophthora fragariaefolia]|uniref:Unnamed protein product n=1 Tax=Phytophthora fragariaefolia TaxID=1490495 RepID=A0A9W6TXS0_9STRA|nr:unnamed protein product [Phytophthora fragariaefolia]